MGMDYYMIPEQPADCEDDFPDGLSYFFEQVGGYGEAAEVAQVSRILGIDLSLFQEISFEDDQGYDGVGYGGEGAEIVSEESQTIWHKVDFIADIIGNLLSRIAAFPTYHVQVLHNPNRTQDLKSMLQTTTIFEAVEKQPLFAYPPDRGYLSQGRIVEDLKALHQTLTCYKSKGVSRVKLLYM